jgi:aminopeptidase N
MMGVDRCDDQGISRNPIKHMLPALVPLFALLLAQSVSAQSFSRDYKDAYPRNPGVDVLHYAFELTLSDQTDAIEGRTTIDARFVTPGQSELRLDLVKASERSGGKGMTVQAVTLGGEPLPFRHERDQLFIAMPHPSAAMERVRVTVSYRGIPAAGLKIAPNKHGDRAFFSDNWSSKVRNWLPTVDHPSDKATSEMIVTAPAHYQVVSNGVLVERTSRGDGTTLTHWKNSVPIAPWLFMLGVADFAMQQVEQFDGKAIQTWVARQDRDAGFYDFAEPTKKVLAYFSDLIGPFSYEKLANVVSNATSGGMEAASAIAYSEASVTGERSMRWQLVIIHEIAHQWFGNAVTENDWNDVWLSEGFATYYTLLYRNHAYGHDDFIAGLKDARTRVAAFYKDTYDFQIVRPYIPNVDDVSGPMMYQKGAWTLHMLREKIGADRFDAGIRAYYAEFKDRNARTPDLLRHLEEASGQKLDAFFAQWLFQGGIPNLDASWRVEGDTVKVGLSQTQPKYKFALDVDVALRYADGTLGRITRVALPSGGGGIASIRAEKEVAEVVLDPETRLLATWRVTRAGAQP